MLVERRSRDAVFSSLPRFDCAPLTIVPVLSPALAPGASVGSAEILYQNNL